VVVNLGVEDLRDLELQFTIHLNWWWQRLYLVQGMVLGMASSSWEMWKTA